MTPTQPAASRPQMTDYGVPRHRKGLLDWSHADRRLTDARHYWMATANPDGVPHAVPIDAIWLDGALYFGGSEKSRWIRNLTANPMLSVHLESGDDVVIIEGEAEKTTITDDELAKRVVDASNAKYGYGMQLPPPPMWVLRPTTAFAWTNLAANATRWRFG